MSELVCYPTGDGKYLYASGTTFAIAHDALTGFVDGANLAHVGLSAYNSNQWYVNKTFITFDTSALPTDAIIIKAVLSIVLNSSYLYVSAGYDFDIVVQNGQPTYPHIPVVTGDFLHSHYSGNGGSINTADIGARGYHDIELTPTGMKWIKGGETTKFCFRSSADIDETGIPTSKTAYTYIYMIGEGDEYKPKLTITYAEFGSVESTIKTTATASAADIAKTGGKRTLEIDNHLIQTTVVAQAVADAYLADYKDQKTKLRITKPTPPPYSIGDTVERISAKLPYAPAVSAVIAYAPVTDGLYYYNLAGRDMLIRKLNVSFSAGNYVSIIELEN